jgi:uncharacterized protein
LSSHKLAALISLLTGSESAVLAFSGGVDSSFLLKAMKLSGMRTLAVTSVSETMPKKALTEAKAIAEEMGADHLIIKTEELQNESFAVNPPDRCFHCKDELFTKLSEIAEGGSYRFVFDGSNADDLNDYRPGRRAAEAHGVRSPLAECGISKNEIRTFSKDLGLSTWDKPSSPCLSSRFPYGRRITAEALARVERAEEYLRSLGLTDLRIRDHGDTARIEVSEELIQQLAAPLLRRDIVVKLKECGYKFIALDLEGYRSGSMNRVLDKKRD